MKTFKNQKGFTLIELLAVIVVLSIVMVLAVTTVLPYAAKARKNAFATEVNSAIQAAGNEMSMIAIDTHRHGKDLLVESNDYKRVVSGTTTKYCFSLKKIVELGWLNKSQKSITSGDYAGYVTVESTSGSNIYKYSIKMHNTQYFVNLTNKDEAEEDDIQDYNGATDTWDCSNFS